MRRPLFTAGLWFVAALVLGAVFAAYLQPGFFVSMANLMWSCF